MDFQERINKMVLVGSITVKTGYDDVQFDRAALMYSDTDKKVYLVLSFGIIPERFFGEDVHSLNEAILIYKTYSNEYLSGFSTF